MIRPTLIMAVTFALAGAAPASAAIDGAFVLPLAGTGSACTPPTAGCGDGGPATAALLDDPRKVAVLPDGAVIFADTNLNRIRRVGPDGAISTVAGTGVSGFNGDGAATSAQLSGPQGVAVIDADSFLIADTGNNRIRRVDGGTLTTVAGNGGTGFVGDGGPATSAEIAGPRDVAARADGSFLLADFGNGRIRRVAGGVIQTVAGAGATCTDPNDPCGDGGDAGQAALGGPSGIDLAPGGGFLIAEPTIHRIRRVTADTGGTIVRVAGRQTPDASGFEGDGGAATAAKLNAPWDVVVLPTGGFAIADTTNHAVRVVDAAGVIQTAAGTGIACPAPTSACGDGGPGAAAQLSEPRGIAVDGAGDLIVGDTTDDRVRRVDLPSAVSPPTSPTPLPPGTPPPAEAPTVNRTVLVQTLEGDIFVRLPGSKTSVPLEQVRLVPDGSKVDTRKGTLRLTVARPNGRTDVGELSEGIFTVNQRRDGNLVDLRLSEQISGCVRAYRDPGSNGAQSGIKTQRRPKRSRRARRSSILGSAASPLTFAPRAEASAKKQRKSKRRRSRRGRVKANGRFRTDGKYGSAVVRGTQWLTIDDCRSGRRDQTRVVVREGKVAVRDFRLARTKLVTKGKRYTAYARARRG